MLHRNVFVRQPQRDFGIGLLALGLGVLDPDHRRAHALGVVPDPVEAGNIPEGVAAVRSGTAFDGAKRIFDDVELLFEVQCFTFERCPCLDGLDCVVYYITKSVLMILAQRFYGILAGCPDCRVEPKQESDNNGCTQCGGNNLPGNEWIERQEHS